MSEIAQRLERMVEALANGVREMRRCLGRREGWRGRDIGRFGELPGRGTGIGRSRRRGETGGRTAGNCDPKIWLPALVRSERSARHSVASAGQVLEAAQAALGGERQAIDNTLQGLTQVLEGTRGQGDRLDDIDEKLGRAFENYRTQVAAAVDALYGHVREDAGAADSGAGHDARNRRAGSRTVRS